ncbi:MAG: hypothetical protein P1V51_09870 [Deltaproteobacteria bacterium]|nr:hypothetical protein [Deltaproteobacteria bacterium]
MSLSSKQLVTGATILAATAAAVLAWPAGAGAPSRFGVQASARWAHGARYARATLPPVANPHPDPELQPLRDHPFDVVVHPGGRKVYLSLHGSEGDPGSAVAVVDLADDSVHRIALRPPGEDGPPGSSPHRLTFHPGGRFLVVTNRFSNFASVIDTEVDRVSAEIPLDFHAQQLIFDARGERAWVSIRYLDQVLALRVKVEGDRFTAEVEERGGLSLADFKAGSPSVHERLVRRCGAEACHATRRGAFVAAADAEASFLSLLELWRPGPATNSQLWRAAVRTREGGYADRLPREKAHAGGVIFKAPGRDPDALALRAFLEAPLSGPGIPVGNPRSKPKALALARGGELLLVGNTGTQDIAVVRTATGQEVGSIRVGNVVNDLRVMEGGGREWLLVTTEGIGFGVGVARDPWGSDSWDRENPAAEYTVRRDLETGRVLPREQQDLLGPADAVDGTAAIKFRDIQNDLVVVDLDALEVPEAPPAGGLAPLLSPTRYESHAAWVRYTSDTAESTAGDVHGDIPPDLMRVVGALPEKMAAAGDRLLVTMQGSNLVQVLRLQPGARDPSERLLPLRTLSTGMQPIGIAYGGEVGPAAGRVLVANFLGGSLSVLELESGEGREIVVDPSVLELPVPATEAETGEILAHTALFSADGDTSCVHCHYLDLGDGRPWGVSQVVGQVYDHPGDEAGRLIIGGTMSVPQMRGLFAIQPFFFEGTLSAFEPRSMLMEHIPADDFAGPTPQGDFTHLVAPTVNLGVDDVQSSMDATTSFEATLELRREAMLQRRSLEVFGKAHGLRDIVRFVGAWQITEGRLLPNPFDPDAPAVARGKALFEHPQVGCVSCHPPPHFALKDLPDNPTQSMPAMVTVSNRDASFTLIGMNRLDALNGLRRDLEPWDVGRAEENESHYTTFPLRGLWDRPPVFLHAGTARTLREVLCVPGQEGLRTFPYEPVLGTEPERPGRREVGLNETWLVPAPNRRVRAHMASGGRLGLDTHGGTSQLRAHEIDDLVSFLQSIE